MNDLAEAIPQQTAGGQVQDRAARDRAARDLAFAALVDRHAGLLYRVAYGLLRNREDAEDCVQECVLKLYRGNAWMEMQEEKAYLARAVWRVGLDRMSQAGAKAMRNAEDVSEMELQSARPTPEQDAVDADQRQLMRTLIEGLPEHFRQALLLSAIEGLSGQEVASVLGVAEGTVRTRLLRAKAELRARFADALDAGKGPGARREVRL